MDKSRTPTTLTVTALALTTANTGYSWTPGANVCGFSIQCRDATDVKVGASQAAVESSGTDYATIKANTAFNSPQDFASNGVATLWFSAASSSKVLEIVSWTNR